MTLRARHRDPHACAGTAEDHQRSDVEGKIVLVIVESVKTTHERSSRNQQLDDVEDTALACFRLCVHRISAQVKWQARRESNPQPAVLETAALPIELLACRVVQFLISLTIYCRSAASGAIALA